MAANSDKQAYFRVTQDDLTTVDALCHEKGFVSRKRAGGKGDQPVRSQYFALALETQLAIDAGELVVMSKAEAAPPPPPTHPFKRPALPDTVVARTRPQVVERAPKAKTPRFQL